MSMFTRLYRGAPVEIEMKTIDLNASLEREVLKASKLNQHILARVSKQSDSVEIESKIKYLLREFQEKCFHATTFEKLQFAKSYVEALRDIYHAL